MTTTSASQYAYSDINHSFSRSFHRVNFKVICKYVMLTIAKYIQKYGCVTHLSLRIIVFCIFKSKSNTVLEEIIVT